MNQLVSSLALGTTAGLANCLGGYLIVRRAPSARSLRNFVALGAGFMLSTALIEMAPEGLALEPRTGPILLLAGYCGVFLLEHTLVPHLHLGEKAHSDTLLTTRATYSTLFGLATHTFFDGVAIGSGFAVSAWLGSVIFLAIFLHKIPEGFTVASIMLAGGRSRRAAFGSALLLGLTTLLGVLVIDASPRLVHLGMPLAAGVTIYVAATDLVPELNREHGLRTALVFLSGVLFFLVLRHFAPG